MSNALFILAQAAAPEAAKAPEAATRLSIFEGYAGVFMFAFFVTLLVTPVMRRLALSNNVVDLPSDPRKVHRTPIAYLGGVAVFLGLLGGVFYSFVAAKVPGLIDFHATSGDHLTTEGLNPPVPLSIVLGMTVITLVGVLDDVTKISPRVKIGGQLFAAAALAIDNVGVKLAAGIIVPLCQGLGIATQQVHGADTLLFTIPLPGEILGATSIPIDVVYWAGTAVIALAVLALCNASNLIDGLDGLLSGTTAISSVGLLVIALGLALVDDGPRDAQRVVLCLALLGACLGFLPHNFNPANIFLGDAGSLLLGFTTCVIILTLGDTGKTHLVVAGLIIYALPIIDTSLAIVRRKLEGKAITAADDQHIHHMLKQALGVKGAVFTLYGIAGVFAVLGAAVSLVRARVVLILALLLASYIGVTAIKIARRRHTESLEASRRASAPPPSEKPTASTQPAATPRAVRSNAP